MSEYQLHPLCALFPRMNGAEFDSLRKFSGIRRDGLAIADFRHSDKYPGFWDYTVSIVDDGQSSSSRPISGEGVGLVLDRFGGRDRWVVTPEYAPSNAIKVDPVLTADAVAAADGSTEYVYFLRAGEFIKIGKSSGHPGSRIAALQTGCPFPITLAAWEFGGLEREAELHRRFAGLRRHGEWFLDDGDLRAHVDALGSVK